MPQARSREVVGPTSRPHRNHLPSAFPRRRRPIRTRPGVIRDGPGGRPGKAVTPKQRSITPRGERVSGLTVATSCSLSKPALIPSKPDPAVNQPVHRQPPLKVEVHEPGNVPHRDTTPHVGAGNGFLLHNRFALIEGEIRRRRRSRRNHGTAAANAPPSRLHRPYRPRQFDRKADTPVRQVPNLVDIPGHPAPDDPGRGLAHRLPAVDAPIQAAGPHHLHHPEGLR